LKLEIVNRQCDRTKQISFTFSELQL
jgi:hypothetical protein